MTVCVWEPADADGSYTRRHRLAGSGTEGVDSEGDECGGLHAPSTVHLFYNGTNHYNVFVPDSSPATSELSPTVLPEPAPASAPKPTIAKPRTSRAPTLRSQKSKRGDSAVPKAPPGRVAPLATPATAGPPKRLADVKRRPSRTPSQLRAVLSFRLESPRRKAQLQQPQHVRV